MPLSLFVGVEVGYRFEIHGGSTDTERPELVGTQDLPEGLGCGC